MNTKLSTAIVSHLTAVTITTGPRETSRAALAVALSGNVYENVANIPRPAPATYIVFQCVAATETDDDLGDIGTLVTERIQFTITAPTSALRNSLAGLLRKTLHLVTGANLGTGTGVALAVEDIFHNGGHDLNMPANIANQAANTFQHIVDYQFTFADP